jgi:protein phosphatase
MSKLEMVGLSDPGVARDRNEDAYMLMADKGIAILADGMGGHLAGEVASAMAVDIIARHLHSALCQGPVSASDDNTPAEVSALHAAMLLANHAIFEASHSKPEYNGMGTTVVAAVFQANMLYVAHVGDSRLYRFRGGILQQITEDHSMVQELLKRGLITPEDARTSANKNLVTRALGVDPSVNPDITIQTFLKDDLYLLCSDGLSDVLADTDIERVMQQYGKNPQETSQLMVKEANTRGGPDNITVVLVRTGKRFSRPKK